MLQKGGQSEVRRHAGFLARLLLILAVLTFPLVGQATSTAPTALDGESGCEWRDKSLLDSLAFINIRHDANGAITAYRQIPQSLMQRISPIEGTYENRAFSPEQSWTTADVVVVEIASVHFLPLFAEGFGIEIFELQDFTPSNEAWIASLASFSKPDGSKGAIAFSRHFDELTSEEVGRVIGWLLVDTPYPLSFKDYQSCRVET